ncbi:MAG TPA: VOC family protein [Solirubrobacterales bacterium]|nr:VOC family protein [Solirubrobacterales bacterium]
MDLVDSYPVVVTDKLRDCRDFYRRWFGFEVGFEASWFVLMNGGGARPTTLAFMHSDHPSSPPTPAAFNGDGAFITFQVADAAAEYRRVVEAGLDCDLPLTEEPWGQRRFGVVDPAGMWIDVVEQIEPAAGWWDQYVETDA